MLEAKIINRGRGPEVAGTPITFYEVLDYHKHGWLRDMIADTLDLRSQEVEVAIPYIDEHRNEVMADYAEMLARDPRGNRPSSRPSWTPLMSDSRPCSASFPFPRAFETSR